jgi:hypothetical protein
MMNNDNRFDELLLKAAQQYNQPPAVAPRDEMWAAIEKAQAERAVRPMRILATPTHRPLAARYTWIGAAAAAVLLVATGVGIGRWSMESGASGEPKAVASAATKSGQTIETPRVESAGIEDPSGESTSQPDAALSARETGSVPGAAAPQAAVPEKAVPESSAPVTGRSVAASDVRAGPGTVRRGATAPTGRSTIDSRGSSLPPSMNSGFVRPEGPYQVAANRHLANAEALLTAFRTDSRDARMDAQLSTWARDLLSNTRLLLDSPAADDPQRARLLGDLELVLAQIVQLSPGAAAQDRELIEGSIQSGQVMTRLRTAIPAGPTRGL